jgi:hypothetical protein
LEAGAVGLKVEARLIKTPKANRKQKEENGLFGEMEFLVFLLTYIHLYIGNSWTFCEVGNVLYLPCLLE